MAERGVGTIIGGLVLIAGIGIGGYLLYDQLAKRKACTEADVGLSMDVDGECMTCKKDLLGQAWQPSDPTLCGGDGPCTDPLDCTGTNCTYDECFGLDYYSGGFADQCDGCKCKFTSVVRNSPSCRPWPYSAVIKVNGIDTALIPIDIVVSSYNACRWAGPVPIFLPVSPQVLITVDVVDQWARPMPDVDVILYFDRFDCLAFLWPTGEANCGNITVRTNANGRAVAEARVLYDHGKDSQTMHVMGIYVQDPGPGNHSIQREATLNVHGLGGIGTGIAGITCDGADMQDSGRLRGCSL